MQENWPTIGDAELRLARIAGLGAVGVSRLCRRFSSADAFFAAGRAGWREAGLPERLFPAVESAETFDVAPLRRRLERARCWAVSLFDEKYPRLLREIHDPPPLLFGNGRTEALGMEAVAIVGSRRPTPYGREHASRLARGFAEAGLAVVSGLAMGIDAIAHAAASEDGVSVAVLGSGVASVYPRENGELAARLCRSGAVISEFDPFARAERGFFPRRNRVISGLVRAVIIVEARLESGSLITARQALEQGREVFVVPGPPGETNAGGHKLLREGAGWAESVEAVLSAVAPQMELRRTRRDPVVEPAVPDEWRSVWDTLGAQAMHVDAIIKRSGLRSSDVLGILLQLELQGLVRQQAGKLFVRST